MWHVRRSPLALAAIAFVMACLAGCGAEVPSNAALSEEPTSAPTPVPAEKNQHAQHATEDPFAPAPGGEEKAERAEVSTDDLPKQPNEVNHPSIVQVLAHRERYHGKEVQIKGYLRVEFEGTAIYLSKEDADYGMTRNGFWVDLSKRAAMYDRKYVLIEGTFDKDSLGHGSLWQGTITNVSRIVELTKHD
jgi:hypothetical protein